MSTARLIAAETQAIRSDIDRSAVLVPASVPGVQERAGHLRGASYLSRVLLSEIAKINCPEQVDRFRSLEAVG